MDALFGLEPFSLHLGRCAMDAHPLASDAGWMQIGCASDADGCASDAQRCASDAHPMQNDAHPFPKMHPGCTKGCRKDAP
jgi:hypothetical protein